MTVPESVWKEVRSLVRPLRLQVRRFEDRRVARRRRAAGDAITLVYHRVAEPEVDPWRLAVAPSRFAEHLSVIAEYFRPVSLEDLSGGLEVGALPRRSVAVTFDDGYRDNLDVAKPLLHQHGVPATVFVVTGYLGAKRSFWWDELEQLCRRATLPELEDRRAVWSRLRELSHAERLAELDALWERSGLSPEAAPSLTPEDLIVLADGELIEIGAHTATHPRLPGLAREAQLVEIRSSKEALEEILGRQIQSFSYPHGEYDHRTVACVRQTGFRRACASGECAVTRRSPRLAIPRVQAPDVSGDELAEILESRLR